MSTILGMLVPTADCYAAVRAQPVRQLMGQDDLLIWHDQMQYKPPYHGGTTGCALGSFPVL